MNIKLFFQALRFICLKNYKINKNVNKAISDLLDRTDIDILRVQDHAIYIKTDNRIYQLWNSNRWYAWLSRGHIYNFDGESLFEWDDCGISIFTMAKMYNKIKNISEQHYTFDNKWYSAPPRETLISFGGDPSAYFSRRYGYNQETIENISISETEPIETPNDVETNEIIKTPDMRLIDLT